LNIAFDSAAVAVGMKALSTNKQDNINTALRFTELPPFSMTPHWVARRFRARKNMTGPVLEAKKIDLPRVRKQPFSTVVAKQAEVDASEGSREVP
jgi:hypothetical protein